MADIRSSVLVIDDDDLDRQHVRRAIARRYDVREAELGTAGLELFRAERSDCVLLDFMLPDVENLTLLDELVREEGVVVMLTGHGNEQVAVEAMKRGAQDYLCKDQIDSETLDRAIRHAIQKAGMQRQIRAQQAQLTQRAEQLQRSNEELQQFAYVASHDLQEPLRSVASFCNLLQENYQGRFDERADHWMDRIVAGAERMKAMIQDLLAYSRVESRGADFKKIQCERILQNVLADLELAAAEAGGRITCGRLPTIHADPSQFAQLMQNLISNALKYRGPQPPRIHIAAERHADAWQFSVADNGIGIESDHFERIFLMFKRLHNRDSYPGTGIGLALCQRIVQRHGGNIWVESEPDNGSTFYFTIPESIATEDDDAFEPVATSSC